QGQPGQGSGGNGGGSAAGKPAGGTEKVYIPSQAQDTGRGQNLGSQPGVQNDLVPYEQVLAQYQSSALSQVNRADIPEQERQLVQQYFSDLSQGGRPRSSRPWSRSASRSWRLQSKASWPS